MEDGTEKKVSMESWEVVWKSKLPDTPPTVVQRRDEVVAKVLARTQRAAGFETRLIQVVRMEVEF